MIQIRQATQEDFKTIQEFAEKLNKFQNESYDKTINPDFSFRAGGEKYLKRVIEKDGVVYLVEDGDEVIGFALAVIEPVGDFRNIDNFCEIDFMWVDEDRRGQGIGKDLISNVEGWCKEKGVKRMRIVASAGNDGAIKLYRSSGFEDHDIGLEKDL